MIFYDTIFYYLQKSFGSCDKQLPVTLSTYARAVRQSFDSIGNIKHLFTRKMAAPASANPVPWSNNQDDYELQDVIG